MKMTDIGILLSGSGSNAQAIVDNCESKKIDGRVTFIGSDKPGVKGLERAKKHKIPNFVADYGKRHNFGRRMSDYLEPVGLGSDFDIDDVFRKSQGIIPSSIARENEKMWLMRRIVSEKELLDKMSQYDFDLLVLAGFMRNLSSFFIDAINTDPGKPRIMNMHPSLLPSFPGTDGYGDTYRYGCKVGGCTVHFVDYGEDTGPIIGQEVNIIGPSDTLDDTKRNGLALEWELYPECIQLFAEGRLEVVHNGHRKVVEILPHREG